MSRGQKLDFFARVYSNKLQVDSHGDVTLANARRARFLRAPCRSMMKWPLLPPGQDTALHRACLSTSFPLSVYTPPSNLIRVLADHYEDETENSLSLEIVLNFFVESRIFLKIYSLVFFSRFLTSLYEILYSDFSISRSINQSSRIDVK